MSVFYVLPARASVATHFARYVEGWFPGCASAGLDLADRLAEVVQSRADAYAVFADELTDKGGLMTALRESYGAEPGDWVIDLRGGPRPPAESSTGRQPHTDDLLSPHVASSC